MTERRSKSVAFVAARGGTGTTTIATNVAVALAHYSRAKTAFLDLNVGRTIADHLLGLPDGSGATVAELVPVLAEMDGAPASPEVLGQAEVGHSSGLGVLLASRDMEPSAATPDTAVQILGGLAATKDVVVCDVPSTFDATSFAALDAAERVLIVATPDVPTLKKTKALLQRLRRAKPVTSSVRVVLNRANGSSELSLQQVEDFLGEPAWSVVPVAIDEAAKYHDRRQLPVLDLAGPLGKALYLTAFKLHPMKPLAKPKGR